MFKNPLKYQEGGSVQDAMKQLVAWIVQNTGLDEGQVSQRLNQILSDDTAKQELVNNLQNMQNGDREAEERIKNMFIPKNAKLGGKIQDFICKHGKGGKAGCGCKKAEGGEIETREKLKPIGMPMQYEGTVYTDRYPASGEQITMGDTGNPMNIAAYNSYNHFGEGISVPTPQYRAMTRGLIDGSGWGRDGKVLTPSEVSKWLNFNKAVDASNRIQNPEQKSLEMENGGMVQKNASGSDGIGKYSASGRKLKTSEVPNMPVDFNPVNVTTETLPTGARRMIFNAIDPNGQAVADTAININGVRYRSPYVPKAWNKNNNSSLTPSKSAWYDANYYFDDAKDDNILNALEYDNGGKVAMSQNGGSDSNWFTRMYNRFIGRRVPDTIEATDRRLKTWTDANGVQHIVEDANVNGNSTVTSININGADTLGTQKITTGDGRYRILNLQPGTPEWRAAMSRNVQEQECGGRIAKEQWGGKATGEERENIANKNPYWEDITINPEFGTTYKLVVPDDFGNVIDEKYFRHYSPNGTNRIKGTRILSENPSIRWSKTYVPGMKDYPWQDYYFNYMKSNVPQRLSNAQRLIPPIYQKNGGKVEKAQSGGNVNILGKITPYTKPVSTMPMDSSEVVYNPLFRALVFKDINGNDVSWARNYDGSYRYRNGKDIMDFDPNQDAGYIPYSKMKAWGRGTSGSTKLSDVDTQNLKKLENKAKSKKETGGKVEKAQDGSILDYYSNKWSNDLNRVKQGWNKFKESAPGKVWGAFMPKPNSESGMIGAFTPGTTFIARIPKQKPTIIISENLGGGKFSAIDDFGRGILYDAERDKGLYQVIDKNDILKPGEDWDIDLPTFNSIDVNEYLKNLGPIINWPKFIGRNVLLPASGVVGSAAAGSYVATKKDKNKKSENKKSENK